MKWEKCTLSSVITVKKGDYITRKEAIPGPYPVILGGQEPAYYINQYNHSGKAIVISRSGASAGYVSIWNEPIFVTDGFLIEPKENIPFEFLYYLLKSKQTELTGLQRGAAIPHVTPSIINAVEVLLPDLPTQHRIASILSAYDDLIENNRRQIKLLEEAAQRLYREWFVELRFPGHENVKIVDGVPEGWRKKPFSQIVTIMSGGTPKTDNKAYYNGSIPFYTPKDSDGAFFSYSTQTYITEEGLSNCHSPLYPEGTIVITARGTVGKTTILGVPMAMNQSCYALKCEQYSMPYYLFFSLNEEVRKLKAMANGGVFNTIIVKTFDNICMFEPELSVVSHFNEMVSTYMESIKLKMKQQQKLIEARDRLLPKLMSGEMEV